MPGPGNWVWGDEDFQRVQFDWAEIEKVVLNKLEEGRVSDLLKAKKPEPAETFMCHSCGGKYYTRDMGVEAPSGLAGAVIKLCADCVRRLLRCDMCDTQIDAKNWVPNKSARQQCSECGSPSQLTIKQKDSFVPSNRLLAKRKVNLWTNSF